MKAKLVTVSFTTRVVCDDHASDEAVFELARPKIKQMAQEEMFAHLESIEEDHDTPFGSGEGEPDIYILPSCYASALINGDFSGLSDEDEDELNKWFERAKPGLCVGCSEESYFTHGHDMNCNQGGDVLEYYFRKPTYE